MDPIAFELFKNAIFSIADEMALTVFRTTYSGVLKDNMDYSTGFADAEGKLVAQGLTLPGHLGAVPTAMASIMRHYRDDIRPGDVFIMNDPFDGGMHLPDIFVFKPLYHEAQRLAFACTVCHHTDVGGRVAGSNASDSTEIYAEGLRIAPLKFYEAGKINKTLVSFIEKNVRLPVKVFGDLRAQLAACHIAEKQFADLVAKYGAGQTRLYMRETIDYAERLTRAALEKLPDGEWSFEDWIDDDGVDYGKPIRLFVTLRKRGGHMVVDWTGTHPQVKGAINNTLSFTKAASYTGVRSVLPQGIPNNEGVFRAIEVICPPGTVGNGVLPAACAARGLTGFRMTDCMFGALAMMLPERVKAAGDGGNTGVSIGGYDAERKPFIYVDFTCGAWGARPWPTASTATRTCSPTWPRTRWRSPRPSSRCSSSPTSSCPTRRARASTAAACRSAATTVSSRTKACCRYAPTGARTGRSACTAAAPAGRRRTISIRTARTARCRASSP